MRLTIFLALAALAIPADTTAAQEPRSGQPSRLCIAVFEGPDDGRDATLPTITAHCRAGDVISFYDRAPTPLPEYVAVRVCDLRYPVRPVTEYGIQGFSCVYAGSVRPTVRASR